MSFEGENSFEKGLSPQRKTLLTCERNGITRFGVPELPVRSAGAVGPRLA